MNTSSFPEFSIKDLLRQGEYIVPRYQRNFAWQEEHIRQLIDDVLDSLVSSDKINFTPYYLGTLVVYHKYEQNGGLKYEVVDGQQRLTTLTLLASYLTYDGRIKKQERNHWYSGINIDFESRSRSSETLRASYNGVFHDNGKKNAVHHDFTEEIVAAYDIIQRVLPTRCKEKGVDLKVFSDYFFEYVRICRVNVPADTDLNHYFEIMNNRGEQLEKHEILKARLLEKLENENDRYVFNKIWEACSAMDKYIQYGFSTTLRVSIFGESWDKFLPQTADDLFDILSEESELNGKFEIDKGITIKDLLKGVKLSLNNSSSSEKGVDEDEPERFSSIINFPNFLPHALSIFLDDGSVSLHDKDLLQTFNYLQHIGADQIKKFAYALLKIRFLFDQNIIKRDSIEDEREWSLKKHYRTEEGNPSYKNTFRVERDDLLHKSITHLQSMFHVSIPSRAYKYWLQASLRYLYNNRNFDAESFELYLFELAKAFVYNRHIASEPLDYEQMIFENEGKPISAYDFCETKTSYGNIENVLLFNFIDYLLWKDYKSNDQKIIDFSFTFRSSVEHYYPQNPINGDPIAPQYLHCIGNLCLITHSKNSTLRHHLPTAKAEYYRKQDYIDSILQYIMLEQSSKWSNKPEETIDKHKKTVLNLLEKYLP